MNPLSLTLNEIREVGFKALVKVLGPIGAAKFIRQFEKGNGDYTKDRQKSLKSLSLNKVKNWLKTPNN